MNEPERGHRASLALIGAGAGARIAGTAAGAITGILTTSIAVRLLGVSDYGALAFALSLVVLIGGLARLGLAPGTTRAIAALQGPGNHAEIEATARGAITLLMATGVVGAIVIVAVLQFAPAGLAEQTRWILGASLGILFLGSNTATATSFLARGLGRMGLMEVPALTVGIVRFLAVALLAALGIADLGAVAIGYAVAGIVAAWVSAGIARRLLRGARRLFRPAPAEARRLLVAAAPMTLMGFAAIAIARFDVMVLGFTGTVTEVGVYEPTLKIVDKMLILVPALFMAAYLPEATRQHTRKDMQGFRELYVATTKLSFIASIPAVVAITAFPEAILRMFYGNDFPVRTGLVWVLVAGYFVNLVFGLNWSALTAAGDRKALVRSSAATFGVAIVLAGVLVPKLGATGAAMATTGSYVALNLMVAYELLRTTGVHPFRRDTVVTVISATIPLAAALLVHGAIPPTGVWAAAAWTAAISAIWIAGLFVIRVTSAREWTALVPRRA